VEGEHLTLAARDNLACRLPARVRLRGTFGVVEQHRLTKDADEIAQIRRAALLGARIFDRALEKMRPGVSEVEIAAELEYAARRNGAEGMSFPTIVAAGPRSALPHARASAARIPRHAPVLLDFGVILGGYCSDMTRTVFVGGASSMLRSVYGGVLEAQLAAVGAVGPGITPSEVDSAARAVLRRARLARFFTHSSGHGVGLEIHELPRIAAGQKEPLSPGMVITIEPGVYVRGKGGVRIEDMVVVTERGCEVLTPCSKELMVL
jgi:Xaa-Pro aminopeptidase